jgi:putative hemolysin
MALNIIVVLVLLVFSAFISGAEVAFFSLKPTEKNELENNNDKKSQFALELLNYPKRLLATILISNNFVNIAIIIISTFIANELFNFVDFYFLGILIQASVQEFIILVVLVTFMILMAGEVVPKIYAYKYPLKLTLIMSYPIWVLEKIFWYTGISRLLLFTTSIIDNNIKRKSESISVEDLSNVLELTTDEEVSEDEHKMLKGIVKFGNTDAKQVMTPRTDIDAFDIEEPFSDLIQKIIECGYSRIPIYKESIDKIEGVLYIKDLLQYLDKTANFDWQKLIRPAFFVPENKKIDDLLSEFKAKKIHIAIVVDEYGGTSGIITLEDIIEEIVGDITDEFDDEELNYSKLDDYNIVFEGKTPLNDMYRILEIDGEIFEKNKGEADTLAGFLLELSGKFLKKNEKINFKNYTFTIEAADKRRIKQIKITINQPEIEDN